MYYELGGLELKDPSFKKLILPLGQKSSYSCLVLAKNGLDLQEF